MCNKNITKFNLQEYESESTPEACFVKDLDKFEMILQAHQYEQDQKGHGELQDFFNSTQGNNNNNNNNNNNLFQEYVHCIIFGEITFEIVDYIFPGSHPRVQWTVGLV